MAKFWPLHHYNQCMGENGRKTLSTACGRGAIAPLQCMGENRRKTLSTARGRGAIAPLQCMGENRRKTLSTTLHTSWERGHVNPIFSTNIAKDAS